MCVLLCSFGASVSLATASLFAQTACLRGSIAGSVVTQSVCMSHRNVCT
jgi:hypothetical protein